MQTNSIFSAPTLILLRVTVYAECIYVFFYQNLVLVAECHADCWQTLQRRMLWRISGAHTDRKSKQVTEHSDTKNYLQSVWGKLDILAT